MSAEELIAEYGGIRLDIGCGRGKQPGWVGLDMRELPGVDIVHDVEEQPWPLPDESVVVAMCSHLVEHINPHKGGFLRFMDELWRVMRVDGEVAISCPHANSAGFAQDPTHCNMVNERTWGYFDPEEPNQMWRVYQPQPWRIKVLTWNPSTNIEVVLVKRGEDWREQSS